MYHLPNVVSNRGRFSILKYASPFFISSHGSPGFPRMQHNHSTIGAAVYFMTSGVFTAAPSEL